MMRQVEIGRTGIRVGAVGLGCMSFGGIYGATDTGESHAALKRALDLGVTHLDTALIYGDGVSEEVIGAFLKANPAAREQFVIATKGGIVTRPQRRFDNTQAYLRDALESSLRRLGTDHVPLYYIHRRDPSVPVEDMMGTLVRFIEEGKIGAIGLSEIAPSTLRRAAKIHHVAAVQSEYSLWSRLPELGMLRLCAELGTTFVSFSPVGRGMLTDTDLDPAGFADVDFRRTNPRFQEPDFSANRERVLALRAFARERGLSTSALAIAWTFAMAPGSVAIPGTRTAAHLADDAAAAAIDLTDDDLDALDRLLPVGWAHGARYSHAQSVGVEDYC